jgi:hypothetical protein
MAKTVNMSGVKYGSWFGCSSRPVRFPGVGIAKTCQLGALRAALSAPAESLAW